MNRQATVFALAVAAAAAPTLAARQPVRAKYGMVVGFGTISFVNESNRRLASMLSLTLPTVAPSNSCHSLGYSIFAETLALTACGTSDSSASTVSVPADVLRVSR